MSALLFAALCALAHAQDLVNAWVSYAPPAAVQADEAQGDPDARLLSYDINVLTPPIKLIPDRLMWINGASFFRTRIRLDGATEFQEDEFTTNSVTWNIMLLAPLNQKWSAIVAVAPGLHSNFVAPLSRRDLLIQSIALVSYSAKENVRLGIGAGYANIFGVPRAFPLVQANIDQPRWRLEALLPQNAALWYMLANGAVSVGAKGTLVGGYYHRGVDQDDAPEDLYIHYSTGMIGPALELARGPLRLTFEGGWAVLRRFDLYQSDTPLTEFDIDQGLAGRLMFSITPGRQRTTQPNTDVSTLW